MSVSSNIKPSVWLRHAVLTCDEMRKAEVLSVARGTHSFYELMQVAGRAVAQAARERFDKRRVLVLCGGGNNGGDGYVAGQALFEAGWPVTVGSLVSPATEDAQKAAAAWHGVGGQTMPLSPVLLTETDLVIDALFGTGLTRPLEGLAAQMVEAVNASGLPVVSADIPSGIDGDTGRVLGTAIRAAVTVTFFRLKRGHCLLPAMDLCGDVIVADTGMYADVLDSINPLVSWNNSDLWCAIQPRLEAKNHKYNRGHALVFGGATLTGAARLAARAAQRMGAGLVTLGAPKSAWEIYAKALESVMVRPLESAAQSQELIDNPKIDAILIGPGLGLEPSQKKLVLDVLASRKPCVLDADALMLFEKESKVLIDSLHDNCVLTPHSGEFHRLFGGLLTESGDKLAQTSTVSSKIGCVVIQKGADTVISDPSGRSVINTNGTPHLATAGSGDVLAGMILGLLAGGMPPFEAACAAAYTHGAAGSTLGAGLIAEDIVRKIPDILCNNGK